jgi:hypothetical protein
MRLMQTDADQTQKKGSISLWEDSVSPIRAPSGGGARRSSPKMATRVPVESMSFCWQASHSQDFATFWHVGRQPFQTAEYVTARNVSGESFLRGPIFRNG